MAGPLGSSPTRSQTFQLVIAGCPASYLVDVGSLLSPSQSSISPSLFVDRYRLLSLSPSSSFPARDLSFSCNMPGLCSCPFPSAYTILCIVMLPLLLPLLVLLHLHRHHLGLHLHRSSLLRLLVSTGKSAPSASRISVPRDNRLKIIHRTRIKERIRNRE